MTFKIKLLRLWKPIKPLGRLYKKFVQAFFFYCKWLISLRHFATRKFHHVRGSVAHCTGTLTSLTLFRVGVYILGLSSHQSSWECMWSLPAGCRLCYPGYPTHNQRFPVSYNSWSKIQGVLDTIRDFHRFNFTLKLNHLGQQMHCDLSDFILKGHRGNERWDPVPLRSLSPNNSQRLFSCSENDILNESKASNSCFIFYTYLIENKHFAIASLVLHCNIPGLIKT